jgi:hypothetical protein
MAIAVLALLTLFAAPRPARAIPIFAQRYRLQCGACHSVLPELNSFGTYFRAHGYRLPLPKHGTTGIALRYQLEYERDPAAGARRFTPGGVLLSQADFGAVSAFVHYNLGAGGGPSALFLGYVTTYNAHTQSTYRLGLFELPLAQSPGQRLDDLAPYGYYGTHVALNDLALSSPRWGAQMERLSGSTTFDLLADLGEFKGAAYGGKPIDTGETTSAASPEVGVFARAPLFGKAVVGAELLAGSRRIAPARRLPFTDAYSRIGFLGGFRSGKVDVQAEQWYGNDANSDGFGTAAFSSGGYARLKYYPSPHWYVGVRYDASANPYFSRDIVYYTAFHVTPHVRLLLQQVQGLPGSGHFGAALTVGAPWPPNL